MDVITGHEGFINRQLLFGVRAVRSLDVAQNREATVTSEANFLLMSDSSANSARTRALKLSCDAMFEGLVLEHCHVVCELETLHIAVCGPDPTQYR